MIRMIENLRMITFVRYVIVSVGALIVDVGLFLSLLHAGSANVAAAAIGYSAGIIAHWILSSRKVFQDRVSERGTAERTQQKVMFVLSALLGLALTMAIVAVGQALAADPRLAKLIAIGASFLLTYALRNVMIFKSAQAR